MSKIPCRLSRSVTQILSAETDWRPFPFEKRMNDLLGFMNEGIEKYVAATEDERIALQSGARKAFEVLEAFTRGSHNENLTIDDAYAVACAGNALLTACYICGPEAVTIVQDAVISLTNSDGMGYMIRHYVDQYEKGVTTVGSEQCISKDYAVWTNVWFASIGNTVIATLSGNPIEGFEPDFGR